MNKNNKKFVLIIMDGWGHGKKDASDAIHLAKTPFIDSLYTKYPNAELITCGEEVGLPEGQMGNSEVGHLNIGAGRVVYQDLVKINVAIKSKEFFANKALKEAFAYAKKFGKDVHLLGLVSEGRVHSSQAHLHALCDLAKQEGVEDTYIHAFTDGRDCDPKSGKGFMENLQAYLKNTNGKVASIIGRYYAMDRDNRWERVKLAYDLLVNGEGKTAKDPVKAIEEAYANNLTDEFIEPIVITGEDNQPLAKIKEGDVVICYNYRTDRCREITVALSQKDFHEHNMHKLDLHYVTMTKYDDTFQNMHIAYEKDNLSKTMGEVLESAEKKQIRIAETEKYPHVTFFFSGGREKEFIGEQRIVVASPKVATYDLQPEMSAPEVTDKICKELKKGETDFVCLNFANPDMVGHTGIVEAVIKACEIVDKSVQKVVETGMAQGYSFVIIADHGNADFVMNADGSPNTAHTVNPVPCFLIDSDFKQINNGKLGDIAPSILHMMGVAIPKEMDGDIIVA